MEHSDEMTVSTPNETHEYSTLMQIAQRRYSCRAFLPRPVPKEDIRRILELAQRTPSWCNSQAWDVVITSGAATDRFREALMAHVQQTGHEQPDIPFPREYVGRYRERRRECGFALYEAVGVQRGDRAASARQAFENFRLFGAPHVAIITTPECLGPYGAIDCGGYVSHFMLAAQSLGVASIAQAALAGYAPFIREYFGIGDDRLVVCAISFGYEDAGHPANSFRTRREPIDNVVTWAED